MEENGYWSKKRTKLWSVEQGLYVIEPDEDTDRLWLCHISDNNEGAIITRAETPSETVEPAFNEFDENSLKIAERRSEESQGLHEMILLGESEFLRFPSMA